MTESGEEGKWWRWEVVRKGRGDDGKWWRWEAVRKGSGDDGSVDDGKWWGRDVMAAWMLHGNLWLQFAVEWLHDCCMGSIAWAMLLWGGSRSTKPCVFPCKVAAADDERYLLCAAVAAGVVLVPPLCFATSVVPVCVVLCVSWTSGCRSHWNGCMNVAWGWCWGGSRSTKPCIFPCKVAAAGDGRYLVCAAVAAEVVSVANWFPPLCSATSGCVCVCLSMRFLNLWLRIALEWLHDCCHLVLARA